MKTLLNALQVCLILTVLSSLAQAETDSPPPGGPGSSAPVSAAVLADAPPVIPLPSDRVNAPELIYRNSFPLKGKNDFSIAYSYLYGDKYLNTMGFLIQDQYHYSPNWGVQVGVGIYKTSTSSEFTAVQNQASEPYAYDPSFLGKLTMVYNPIYGKMLIGDSIIHMRIDAEFGLEYMNEKAANTELTDTTFSRIGPVLGLNATIYTGKAFTATESNFTINLGTDFLLSKASSLEPGAGMRKTWLFNLGAGALF